MAQARADADETVEEARANAEACEARTEEKMVALHTRHTEMCAEFDKKDRKMQYELARSQWAEDRASCVQQHAAKVWGAAWQTEDRPAPKVFSLVGKSVSEVRGMSGEVSQEGTGTEERVALNQLKCTSHFFSRLYPGHTALLESKRAFASHPSLQPCAEITTPRHGELCPQYPLVVQL